MNAKKVSRDDVKKLESIYESERALRFVRHIERHLKTRRIRGKVICKICGKDIDVINAEEIKR